MNAPTKALVTLTKTPTAEELVTNILRLQSQAGWIDMVEYAASVIELHKEEGCKQGRMETYNMDLERKHTVDRWINEDFLLSVGRFLNICGMQRQKLIKGVYAIKEEEIPKRKPPRKRNT